MEEYRTSPSLESVKEEIGNLFDTDAYEIAISATRTPLTVVTGPTGNGKSHILLPRVKTLLNSYGLDVDFQHIETPSNPPSFANRTAQSSPGVIIMDEASGSNDKHQRNSLHETLRQTQQKGWHVVAVIAYGIDTRDIRAKNNEVARWVESSPFSQRPSIIEVAPFRLDRRLAEDFIVATRQDRGLPPLSRNIMNFILEIIPYNLRFLSRFALKTATTHQEAIEAIRDQCRYIVGIYLPQETQRIDRAITKFGH